MPLAPPTDRPHINAALACIWRAPDTLQFGATAETARVVRNLPQPLLAVLALCDGLRTRAQVLADAVTRGVSIEQSSQFLMSLRDAGVLDDGATALLSHLALDERERLEPERSALSLLHHGGAAAAAVLRHRGTCWVQIEGDARIVPFLGALFAAAGIGHVTSTAHTPRTAYDAFPGITSATRGRPTTEVTAGAVTAAKAHSPVLLPAPRAQPDLRILAVRGPVIDPATARAATADGVPVLAVHARELTGVVGPLVLAGASACLRCLDLHRTDRDEQWPLVAAQLANRRAIPPQPVSLLTILAGYTAAQGLAFLDGDESIATRNGTLELSAPDWRIRRRGWLPHPECGCMWPVSPMSEEAFASREGADASRLAGQRS